MTVQEQKGNINMQNKKKKHNVVIDFQEKRQREGVNVYIKKTKKEGVLMTVQVQRGNINMQKMKKKHHVVINIADIYRQGRCEDDDLQIQSNEGVIMTLYSGADL